VVVVVVVVLVVVVVIVVVVVLVVGVSAVGLRRGSLRLDIEDQPSILYAKDSL
jgi:hypothetical protein